jgi:hypothetical protein
MIPQHIQPKNNVLANICEACHKRINSDDIAGMFAHAYKLQSSTEKFAKEAKILYTIMSRWMTGSDDPNIIYDQNAWLEKAKERRLEKAKEIHERIIKSGDKLFSQKLAEADKEDNNGQTREN